jgi:hypothetical protein
MPSAHRVSFPFICAGCLIFCLSAAAESAATLPQTLVEWKAHHFSVTELRDGTSDDTTRLGNDWSPNLIRYALGYGPREPMPSLLAIRIEGEQLEVLTPPAVDRPDIICRLEVSHDLKSWNTAETHLSENSTTQPADLLDASATFSMDLARYFRLYVQRTIEDSDNDGLHDDHELAWFASIEHGPADDPDHDEVATEDELLVGRSPYRGVVTDRTLAAAATGLEVFMPLE